MSERWLLWLAHGPKVFVGLLAVATLLGAWRGPAAAAWWRGARRRWALRELGEARDDVPAGEGVAAVLRGELRCDGAERGVAVSVERYAPLADGTPVAPRVEASGALSLKTRDGVVALPAEVDVAAGTTEEGPRRRDEAPQLESRRSIDVGAVVRVEGVVEPAGGEAAVRGYRGAAPSWRMVPGRNGRVRIAAESPGAAGPARRSERAAGAATALALSALALTGLGQATLTAARARRGEVTVGVTRAWCEGEGVRPAMIATASPLQRPSALDEVALGLRCDRARPATTAATVDAALRLRGAACVERAAAQWALGEPRRAAEVGLSCGDAGAAVRAGWQFAGLGEFARASAALRAGDVALRTESDLHRAVVVHALGGAWSAAAEVARRAAELAGSRRAERDDDPYTKTMWCVADATAARGGDAAARARLEQRLRLEGTPACRVLRAELAIVGGEPVGGWVGGERGPGVDTGAVEPFGRPPVPTSQRRSWRGRPDEGALRAYLGGSDGLRAEWAELVGQRRPGGALDVDEALVLRPFVAATLRRYRGLGSLTPVQEADAAALAAEVAWVESAAGDHAAALATARWASDHAGGLGRYERLAILHESAWLAAAAADRGAVDAALGELEGAGEAAPDAMVPLAVRRWADADRVGLAGLALRHVDNRDAREAVTAGRGDMLFAWLRRWSGVLPVADRRAVLAGLVFGVLDRDEARAWLRTEDSWIDPGSLGLTWRAAAQRLAIATRLGDRDTADAMRGVVARHRAAVERPDLAMTLSVLGAY